jgi:hypothetical protein
MSVLARHDSVDIALLSDLVPARVLAEGVDDGEDVFHGVAFQIVTLNSFVDVPTPASITVCVKMTAAAVESFVVGYSTE